MVEYTYDQSTTEKAKKGTQFESDLPFLTKLSHRGYLMFAINIRANLYKYTIIEPVFLSVP